MNTPKVSIVIPSYNTSVMLKKMVDCIVAQSFKDWELIVVDDGSQDDTLKMMNNYSDARVRCVSRNRQPKGGQTCRNTGFDLGKGEYVIFFDSDDLISPDCLKQRVEYMESHPNLDFAVFPAATFYDERKMNGLKVGYGFNKGLDTLTSVLTTNYQFTVWTNVYRREALLRYRIIWDEKVKVYQDFDFNLSVAMAGLRYDFAVNAQIDYFYRIDYNKNSVCSNVLSEEKNQSTCYLFEKTLDVLKEREDYEQRKSEFYKFACKHLERLVIGGQSKLLSDYTETLSIYYNESRYLKFHKKLESICENKSKRKRTICFWYYRILFFGEYQYAKHLLGILINH